LIVGARRSGHVQSQPLLRGRNDGTLRRYDTLRRNEHAGANELVNELGWTAVFRVSGAFQEHFSVDLWIYGGDPLADRKGIESNRCCCACTESCKGVGTVVEASDQLETKGVAGMLVKIQSHDGVFVRRHLCLSCKEVRALIFPL
jgi:hypothetical protein